MSKNNMYKDLVKCNVVDITDVNNTKVYENDIVIKSDYVNVNKEYKVDTDNMTNEEIIISLLAKQTLYLKTIRNIVIFVFVLTIIGVLSSLCLK